MQQAAEVKVGIFVVAAVVLGVFVASNLKGGIAGKARSYEFAVWFEAAPGVGKGTPVRLSGVEIGEVTAKDIVKVDESTNIAVPLKESTTMPFDLVTTWSLGQPGTADAVAIEVGRRHITGAQAAAFNTFTRRQRSVAQLTVRIRNQYELFSNYSYGITGGVVFGDKQLEISDIGPDGFPLSTEASGQSLRAAREAGQRVAVLGAAPVNLDKIVGNVQSVVDEETTDHTKRIVANIDRATEEAAELVKTMRETMVANKGNVDRMLGNAAEASDSVRAGVADARVLAGETLRNLQKASASGKRLLENNEPRFNRVAGNIEQASASLARVAKGSEGKVDQTMADVAAIAREVREMVASNREYVDNITAKVSATVDDLRGAIAARAATGERDAILRLVERTRCRRQETFAQFHANVAEATKHVSELTGDPATQQILHNLERTTSELREMVADLRHVTGDPQMQEDVKTSVHNVRTATEGFNNTFGRLRDYKPFATADVYYVPDQNTWRGDLNVDLAAGHRNSFHVGMDNITHDPVVNAQLGRLIFPKLRFRYGFYRSQLGVGADYDFWPGARLRTEFYRFEDPNLITKFTYRTPWGFTGLVGVEDIFDKFDWTFGVQFGKDIE
ncbi:MAG: hypothetical protein HYU66_05365 [Armatimonadetes bacterium]|nr:hypothetical protein [Armatimonadota bacterium]